jgi:hypothetical protein
MSEHKCPGQDQRYWKPEDIFFAPCPACGAQIEFWKDEPLRTCPGCQRGVRNPRLDLGCADHCKHGPDCTGQSR